RRAVRTFQAYSRHPPGYRRHRPGFAGTRFRPSASGSAARTTAKAIRVGKGLEQRWCISDRNRSEEHRTVTETQGQRHRPLAFQRGLFAEHVDAERNIGPGLLARHIAETRSQPIECADKLVHARRSLHALLDANCGQELIEARDGDAQLTFKPSISIERQAAPADPQNVALLYASLRDVDAPARCLHFAETHRPGFWGK